MEPTDIEGGQGTGGRDEPSQQNLQQRLLTAVAKRALTQQAAGNDLKVMRWWCQVAELMCGLAWRARGWHIQINTRGASAQAHWLVALPAGSAEVRPMSALAMTRDALEELAKGRALVDAARLQELSGALDGLDGTDPVVRAARALARVVWDRGINLESAYSTTSQLLNAVEAMAAEFENSRPQPRASHYVGPLSTMPIHAPIIPASGEAAKVIGHVVELSCHHLEIANLSV